MSKVVLTPPITQPFADLWRTYAHTTQDIVQSMTDIELIIARKEFEALTSNNYEWTHFGARDEALKCIKIEQKRRNNAELYRKIQEHEDAIKIIRDKIRETQP